MMIIIQKIIAFIQNILLHIFDKQNRDVSKENWFNPREIKNV